jgi:hypothetical protein
VRNARLLVLDMDTIGKVTEGIADVVSMCAKAELRGVTVRLTDEDAFYETTLHVPDTIGRDVEVIISAYRRKPETATPVSGLCRKGMRQQSKARVALVHIYLNSDFRWAFLAMPMVTRMIHSILAHEMTHAREIHPARKMPPREAGTIQPSEKWMRKYADDYDDVRARMRQIYVDIYKEVTERVARGERLDRAITTALDRSLSWTYIDQYMSKRARDTTLKGLMTSFEDEGIGRPS